jgi:hypothetical protein
VWSCGLGIVLQVVVDVSKSTVSVDARDPEDGEIGVFLNIGNHLQDDTL